MRRKEKNRILREILVEDYAAEGKSIARVEGKVVFIEGAVPGDVADVRLTKSKKDWAEGKAVHFHKYAKNRTTPFCEHFGVCGGCKWQMLPYEEQLQFKEREVASHLQRIGKIDLPQPFPIAGADTDRYYRNKLEFTFSNRRYFTNEELAEKRKHSQTAEMLREERPNLFSGIPDEPALGFHVPGYFDKVIDIHQCHLQSEPSNAIRNFIRNYALQHEHSFYNLRAHEGWLRTMILRSSTLGEWMVNLCFGYDAPQERNALLQAVRKAFPSITTLLYTINPKKNDSIHDLEPQVFDGSGYITEKLGDYVFKIGPKSFFQTNTRQAEQLYSITRDFAKLSGNEVLYDLYCGTGSIGIFCSKEAKKIIGVEVIEEAIQDARINAEMNQVAHAQFFAGDVIDICTDEFFALHGRPDVIITDPPRAGMHAALVQKLLEIEATRIVYVSCNPATQARDLQLLDAKYKVEQLQAVDLFPHTHHIENVVGLVLKEGFGL
ncbi:MAG: 23S rRNA (uracil(1939)-C(5))-methyltransferase RlmD [Bacteroidetes bacterium]|nr:23S rRNA (uracil(1939)-C(5))-methyltransferase RlmD [Bacteroidota bacterium]